MQSFVNWLRHQASPSRDSDPASHECMYEQIPQSSQPSSLLDEERAYIQRRQQQPNWTLDRGTGFYKSARTRNKRASLVETGRYAGRSRVAYVGIDRSMIMRHIWKRDFFGAAVDSSFLIVIAAFVMLYITSFLMWAAIYWEVWRHDDTCFFGFVSFQSAFLFAIETQQTIGFGVRAPGDCWVPAWVMALHSIFAIILDSLFLGIIFAKISHPKNRGRTILISDCAVIARRDGVLKFMFRVGDIRKRSVMSPKVHVYLYRWGAGRTTAEGEHIPVRAQELSIGYIDGMVLLPVTIEHNIDEASPLYGCTQQILQADQAEVVVTFEGTNEFGDAFMARRSYLPSEIHWGYVFCPIISPARPGETHHSVDLSRFHDVETQMGHDLLPPSQMSRRVLAGGARTVPAPLLGENTLVLSDDCVVASRHGQLTLMFRVGDTRPGQMMDVCVRAWVIRWQLPLKSPEGEDLPFECLELELSPVQPLLRYPCVVSHPITPTSPLYTWTTADGMLADADAEIVVVCEGVIMGSGRQVVKSRTYDVLGSVKWGFVFQPCVVPPVHASDSRPHVEWGNFHVVRPLHATSHHSRAISRGDDEAWLRPSSRVSESSTQNVDAHSRFSSGFDVHEGSRRVGSPTTSWSHGNTPPSHRTPSMEAATATVAATSRTESWRQTRSLAAAVAQFGEFQQAQHQLQQQLESPGSRHHSKDGGGYSG